MGGALMQPVKMFMQALLLTKYIYRTIANLNFNIFYFWSQSRAVSDVLNWYVILTDKKVDLEFGGFIFFGCRVKIQKALC